MRLDVVDHGHAPAEAAILDADPPRRAAPSRVGVLKTLYYRPSCSGGRSRPRSTLAMRGPSDWSRGRARALRRLRLVAQPVPLLNELPRRGRVVRAR